MDIEIVHVMWRGSHFNQAPNDKETLIHFPLTNLYYLYSHYVRKCILKSLLFIPLIYLLFFFNYNIRYQYLNFQLKRERFCITLIKFRVRNSTNFKFSFNLNWNRKTCFSCLSLTSTLIFQHYLN